MIQLVKKWKLILVLLYLGINLLMHLVDIFKKIEGSQLKKFINIKYR
jgi:hypothetical protein